ADALDLPLCDGIADAIVSVNGLHVVADHAGFLREIGRVARTGGRLSLLTPWDGPGLRSTAFLAAARMLRVTPVTPPTLARLTALVEAAGFTDVRFLGGTSIAGIGAVRA